MNKLGKLFLKGLAVAIPLVITLAILWWMATGAERLLGGLLKALLPRGWYVPGLGLLSGLIIIVVIGLLSQVLLFQRVFQYWEGLLQRLPLIKTIYTALKDFIDYFRPDQKERFNKVVLVRFPGQDFQMIGFVTRENFEDLPFRPAADDPVAVYCPMSYQIGGYTLFLPRACVEPLDLPFEDAMRLAVTGGVSRQSEPEREVP